MTGATRAERAQRVKQLHDEGHAVAEIVQEVGISSSYIYDLLRDPTGELGYARKQSYNGICEDCGKPTSGANGPNRVARYCRQCAPKHSSRRVWSKEIIIDAIQRFAEKNGRPPLSSEWRRADSHNHYPARSGVAKYFGSWNNAIEAAGFTPVGPGRHARNQMKALGFRAQQVLSFLEVEGPSTTRKITLRLGLERTEQISHCLHRLARRGLVEAEDGGRYQLTEAGLNRPQRGALREKVLTPAGGSGHE